MRDEASVERPSKWEVLMAVNKAHDEFYALDLENGWEVPAGYPAGIEQKILSGSLDEDKRRGSRTRLLRIAPGVFTKEPFVHEYWEEVFLVSPKNGIEAVKAEAHSACRRFVRRRLRTVRGLRMRPVLTAELVPPSGASCCTGLPGCAGTACGPGALSWGVTCGTGCGGGVVLACDTCWAPARTEAGKRTAAVPSIRAMNSLRLIRSPRRQVQGVQAAR
jgi:hypothetical protein